MGVDIALILLEISIDRYLKYEGYLLSIGLEPITYYIKPDI